MDPYSETFTYELAVTDAAGKTRVHLVKTFQEADTQANAERLAGNTTEIRLLPQPIVVVHEEPEP